MKPSSAVTLETDVVPIFASIRKCAIHFWCHPQDPGPVGAECLSMSTTTTSVAVTAMAAKAAAEAMPATATAWPTTPTAAGC